LQINQTIDLGLYDLKVSRDPRAAEIQIACRLQSITQKNICAHSHPVTMQRSPFNVLKMPAITSKRPCDLCTSKVYACLRAKPLTKMNITIAAQAMQNEVCNIGP
jgi:hypothetical protein